MIFINKSFLQGIKAKPQNRLEMLQKKQLTKLINEYLSNILYLVALYCMYPLQWLNKSKIRCFHHPLFYCFTSQCVKIVNNPWFFDTTNIMENVYFRNMFVILENNL